MVHKKCSLNIVFLDFLLSLRCNVKCIKQVVMNSEIILEINGYKCNLLKYKYCFSRNIDREGRPVTGVLGGNIYIEMESNGSNCILDMMLAGADKSRSCFFFRPETTPVWGKIRNTVDDMMFRELAFDEAYIYYYGETMDATEGSPMFTRFLISPTRLDINRTIRMDRRINTIYGSWWEEYKEESSKVITCVLEKDSIGEIVEVYWKDENSHQRINEFPHNGIATLCAVVKHATEGDKVNFILKFEDGTLERFSGVVDSRGIVEVKNVKLS